MGHDEMATLYDRDFYAWTQQTGGMLRRGCFDQVDMEHVAEEIEDMGNEKKHTLKSQTRRLILHLLRWQFQPERRSESWIETIGNAGDEIDDVLTENPSLWPMTANLPSEVYPRAAKRAAQETGLPRKAFPPDCPYNFDQLVDDDFLPK
ncbi:MAG: DUF29 domain-containing protein [Acidobacteriia bacterium]|nr:DUF29 domain-containing protein [Terriglobia bacterium]